MFPIRLRSYGLSGDKDQIAFASTVSITELDDAVFEKGLQSRLCSGLEVCLGLPKEEMRRTFVRRMIRSVVSG